MKYDILKELVRWLYKNFDIDPDITLLLILIGLFLFGITVDPVIGNAVLISFLMYAVFAYIWSIIFLD